MFRSICESPWVTTAAAAAASFAALLVWLRRKPFLVAFYTLFTMEILADALRSGSWSPLHLLASPYEDAVGIGFVLLGDFRFFLLIERFARRPDARPLDPTARAAWAGAAALTLVTLMTIQGTGYLLPTNLRVCLELRKPAPDGDKIGRMMRSFFFAVACQGTMQVITIVIMARFVSGI